MAQRLPSDKPRPSSPPRYLEGAIDRDPGEPRGDSVSPVLSDATGVRKERGERGRVDATRSRRRYITH